MKVSAPTPALSRMVVAATILAALAIIVVDPQSNQPIGLGDLNQFDTDYLFLSPQSSGQVAVFVLNRHLGQPLRLEALAGERQLLTIARAFIADPAILILDEATSSVDTRTERLVQQAMAELRKGRTAFVIAHRLSTIRDADTILVMEHGSIVERGNHESLMAAKGPYHRLYTSQFAGGSEPTHAV